MTPTARKGVGGGGCRMQPESPWLTVEQAAEHLTLSKSYLKKEIHAGRVPHRRLGRRVVISRAELDIWALAKSGVPLEALA